RGGETNAIGDDAQPRAEGQRPPSESGPPRFKLGLVTYELAKDWDIETIIRNCEATGFEGVELRTTHKHGVEPSLSKERREEIGRALKRCGDIASEHGVEIWVEVHGQETEIPSNIHRIMEVANHPSVGVCWNSNDTDVEEGSVKSSFDLLKNWLRSCHINELW